jgi:hypothetical protein
MHIFKIVLDRKSISVYFQDTSVICLGLAGALTEREKADMRQKPIRFDDMAAGSRGMLVRATLNQTA